MASKKIMLDENEMPKQWYNILPDLPKELPPMIHPGTKEPVKLPPPLFLPGNPDRRQGKTAQDLPLREHDDAL